MAGVEIFDDPLMILIDEMGRLGLENTSGVRRYYSLYLGVVVLNDDPSKQGMVKVVVRATGQKKALPLFARPSSPFAGPDYGFYTPPEVGDVGWVSFDHGDPTARPRYLGSIWKNPKKDGDPQTSDVPEEFKNDGPPKIRGFKTPGGSGWRVSDQEDDPFLELWTGAQDTPGELATKKHQFLLSQRPGEERIKVLTEGGQEIRLVDAPSSEAGIFLSTVLGHLISMDDSGEVLEVRSNGGLTVRADDQAKTLRLITPSGHELSLEELSARFLMSAAGNMEIVTQSQLLMQVGSTFDMGVVGAATWAIGAALTVTAGIISLLSAGAGIVVSGGIVLVGLASLAGLRLVTEAFLATYNANVSIHNANVALFNAHTHAFIGNLGAPGVTSPSVSPMSSVAPVSVDTPNVTQTLRGN